MCRRNIFKVKRVTFDLFQVFVRDIGAFLCSILNSIVYISRCNSSLILTNFTQTAATSLSLSSPFNKASVARLGNFLLSCSVFRLHCAENCLKNVISVLRNKTELYTFFIYLTFPDFKAVSLHSVAACVLCWRLLWWAKILLIIWFVYYRSYLGSFFVCKLIWQHEHDYRCDPRSLRREAPGVRRQFGLVAKLCNYNIHNALGPKNTFSLYCERSGCKHLQQHTHIHTYTHTHTQLSFVGLYIDFN